MKEQSQAEEYVYHVDRNDKVIGKVKRSEMRKKNLMHRSIAVLTFNSKGEILIHKRTATKDKFPSYYDMINGGVLDYGETYDEASKREIEEEIGVKNPDLKFLFDAKYDKDDNKVIYKVYKQIYDGPIKFQKEEIESGRFVKIKELEKITKKEKFCPDGIEIFNKYLEEYYNNGKEN